LWYLASHQASSIPHISAKGKREYNLLYNLVADAFLNHQPLSSTEHSKTMATEWNDTHAGGTAILSTRSIWSI
jgi:hypothetical protein